ncbi:TauD/TfdA dioxygenase family protein [Desertibaculum subflavum]|uniref:TauD/TfdA dioxygenase family protein n=1 Tax=Desertibaculum subflavum TaxID=2268458 RepID=UPI000E663A28
MAITIMPVTPDFAAEVHDIDLAKPLTDAEFAEVEAAFEKYSVLVFCDQHLEAEQHLDFARRFGPLETSIAVYRGDENLRVRPEIADVSNLNARDQIWGEKSRLRMFQLGNRLWHTDSSFKRVPAKCSLLYARAIPPIGGHTEFADLRAAYDALPGETKRRIEGLVAEHSIQYSRAKLGFAQFNEEEKREMPPVPQVLVRTHAGSKRKTLYIASHAGRIIGLAQDEAEKLLAELTAHATQRQFVYTHRWRVHDLVMWDDRCTMHRGTEFDDLRWRRDMQRATVSDTAPTCEQEGARVAAA